MGCYNSTVLNAPADQVWAALRNFHDLSWAANVVTSVQAVGEAGGTEVGAKRILNEAFLETLHELDDDRRYLRYSIDDGPGPTSRDNMSGYFGEVTVHPVTDTGQSFVVWTSTWASEGGDGSVQDFCDPIYQALLGDMKAHFA